MLIDMTNKELIELVESLQKELKEAKRYGLVWERSTVKEEVGNGAFPTFAYNHERSFQTGEHEQNHMLIEGDNFHALTVLKHTHQEKVDIIYIDPPYNTRNTGNKRFNFNDTFSKKEDEWIHSGWLSFMEKRLRLARELLTSTGVIFIQIDDNELAQSKFLCDEIFGEKNFLHLLVRKTCVSARLDSKHLSNEQDYILCYAKNSSQVHLNRQQLNVQDDPSYKLSDKHENTRGKYKLNKLDRGSIRQDDCLLYEIMAPDGSLIQAGNGRNGWRWRWSKTKVQWGIEHDFIEFKKVNGQWNVYFKQYQFVDNQDRPIEREVPFSTLLLDGFQNEKGNAELKQIVGERMFSYPKPTALIKHLLSIASNQVSVVLDFFAGSGTTGQAVLELNKEDGGNRQFILCTNNEIDVKTAQQLQKQGKSQQEMEEHGICRRVTYPRLKKVMQGFDSFNALGGNLFYYEIELKEITIQP